MITQERLTEIIQYDKNTGIFKWKTIQGKGLYTLKKSGTILKGYGKRYKQISIDGKKYRLHQLAWLYLFGCIPKMIDHIDGDGFNNKIENLRDVTSLQNQRNMKKALNNTSGVTGVYWSKEKQKWEASIQVEGKKNLLGRFVEKKDAIKCRKKGEEHYEFHRNHGR